MNDARWQRLSGLLDELFDLETAARERRLAQLEAEDATLAAELRRLLAADDAAGLLDAGVVRAAPTVMSQLSEPAATTPPTEAGKRVGHYRLVERVGSGGMGEVWRGERVDDFEQQVAVKLIRPLLDSPQLRERFARERRILARLDHPNIARLLDGGVAEDGTPWYAMEFVRGSGIVSHADARALDARARVELLLQVCGAVAHAHSLLVIHRDLKPSNILVDEQGRARVLDFGIARLVDEDADVRLTGTGVRVFSPAYAAPEQIRGESVGTAADVFALGAVLFELLTGLVPHPGRSTAPDRLIASLEHEGAPRPSDALRTTGAGTTSGARTTRNPRDLAGDLDTIVATALQPDPARRYAGAAQLADDLRRWLDGRPIAAQPDTAGYRMRKFVARHRIAVGSASAVLLALVAGLGLALWQANVAREHAARADVEATRANAEAQRAEREAQSARAQTARVKKVKDFLMQTFVQADPLRRTQDSPTTVAEALDSALARIDAELADDPALQADLLDDFGEIRAAQGRFEDSQALLDRALAIAEAEHGQDHPAVAETLLNLGALANYRGKDLDGAEPLERALAILERDDGGDPLQLANALNSMATIHQMRGDNRHAREVIERSVAIFRRHAPQHAGLRIALTNLAMLYSNENMYAEAEALLLEAIASVEKDLGPSSAHLWPNLFTLGDIQYALGRPDDELRTHERALAVARENYPGDHPWTASSLIEVGSIHARRDRMKQGEPLMREGIAMYQRLDSPIAITGRRRLAIALRSDGRAQEALEEMSAAWDTCIARDLRQQQTCIVIRANRAHMLALHGQGDTALREADAALAALAELGDGLASEVGQARQARAAALAALGRRDEAFALQDQVIADLGESFGADHQETLNAISARKRLESIP
jgi:serine/threonine protein kinase